MISKIAVCLLMTASGLAGGITASNMLIKRERILAELMEGLRILKAEIYYTHDHLDLVAARVAEMAPKTAGLLFDNFQRILNHNDEADIKELWQESVMTTFPLHIPLKEKDCASLLSLGQKLGKTDVDGQCRFIDGVIVELSVRHDEACETVKNKAQLVKTLGVAAGTICAVLYI